MPDQELIDGLVATYRTLNMTVRTLPEAQLRRSPGSNGTSVRDIVQQMRDDELRFSQALKVRITTGSPMPDLSQVELPVVGTEHQDDPTAVLIAQFGTARESTLAMLRSLPDPEWDTTEHGSPTITESIRERLAADRRHLEQIASLIGTR